MFPFTSTNIITDNMHSTRSQNENHRNLANLRTTPDAKPRNNMPNCCQNHPDKNATHALPQPHPLPPIHYCEKCSIMLASKGHNIIKLATTTTPTSARPVMKSPLRTPRQQQIQGFLGELSWHLQELGRKYGESEELLRESQTHFGNMLEQVTAYFKQIEEVLEVQKYLSYNAILNHRAAIEAELRLTREAIQHEAEELTAIGNDIQNNMEAVEQVQPAIYESIMQNYRNKTAAAFEFHQYQLNALPRPCISLPEIPKMLYSLADKLTLQTDSPRETLAAAPAPSGKQSLSSRLSVRHPSVGNSRRQATSSCSPRPAIKKCLSNLANLKNAQSFDSKGEIAFSFQSNEGDENPLQKALFGRREGFLPQEMVFRESLSLTQIRQNQEEEPQIRRYGGMLQETIPIPEEMMASQQSIGGYFATNTLNYSAREYERGEQTQTLLIC